MPSQIYNVDQSPLPFAINTKKTYEQMQLKNKENRNKTVWISQPVPVLEKRQCTPQICFRPEGKQPRISVIFRGLGKRISAVENASWPPDVDVTSDENADKWYGEDNQFTASERRILITHWVGEAYNTLVDERYDGFRREFFGRTGCLLTADGSGDDLVRPEGSPGYKVPPTSIIEPTAQPAVSSIPKGVTRENDDELLDIEDDGEEIDMVVELAENDDGNIFDIFNLE